MSVWRSSASPTATTTRTTVQRRNRHDSSRLPSLRRRPRGRPAILPNGELPLRHLPSVVQSVNPAVGPRPRHSDRRRSLVNKYVISLAAGLVLAAVAVTSASAATIEKTAPDGTVHTFIVPDYQAPQPSPLPLPYPRSEEHTS